MPRRGVGPARGVFSLSVRQHRFDSDDEDEDNDDDDLPPVVLPLATRSFACLSRRRRVLLWVLAGLAVLATVVPLSLHTLRTWSWSGSASSSLAARMMAQTKSSGVGGGGGDGEAVSEEDLLPPGPPEPAWMASLDDGPGWFYPRCPKQANAPGFIVPPPLAVSADQAEALRAMPTENAGGDAAQLPMLAGTQLSSLPGFRAKSRSRRGGAQQVGNPLIARAQRERRAAAEAFRQAVKDGTQQLRLQMVPSPRGVVPQPAVPPAAAAASASVPAIAPAATPAEPWGPLSLPADSLYWQLQLQACEHAEHAAVRADDPALPVGGPGSDSADVATAAGSKPSSSSSLFIKSGFHWAQFEAPFLHAPDHYDSWSRAADLTSVSFAGGKIHIWGLSEKEMDELGLPEWTPFYKFYHEKLEVKPERDQQVEFHPDEALDLSTCGEWVEESTFFLARWIPHNNYHSHNDMLFPLFQHLRSLGLLDPSKEKRMYYFTNPTLHETVPLVEWIMREHMFRGNLFDFASIESQFGDESGKHLCFRHVRWGRGQLASYARKFLPLSRDCGSLESTGMWPLGSELRDAANKAGVEWKRFMLGPPLPELRSNPTTAVEVAALPEYAAWFERERSALDQGFLPRGHFDQGTAELYAGDRVAFQQWVWKSLSLANQLSPPGGRVRQGWTPEGERIDWDSHTERDIFGLSPDASIADVERARAECKARRQAPHIVWIERNNHPRSIANKAELASMLSKPSDSWTPRLTRCCGWGGGSEVPLSPIELVSLLRDADIILGVHGAGLAHLMYVPAGGMLAEMQVDTSNWLIFFPALAAGLNMLDVEIDLRLQAHTENGVIITPEFGARIAEELASQWTRHNPCSLQEEQARREWYDTKRDYHQRFPLGDLKNDRHVSIAWSRKDE